MMPLSLYYILVKLAVCCGGWLVYLVDGWALVFFVTSFSLYDIDLVWFWVCGDP